jgi:hypothetical protein
MSAVPDLSMIKLFYYQDNQLINKGESQID